MIAEEPLVRTVGLCKRFGKVVALEDVDFAVYPTEVVGLVGDNGAGKSTLIKILSGVYPPEKGEIFFEGRKIKLSSPSEARSIGIETVYQDMGLVNLMNIWRNFFLGREMIRKKALLDKAKMKEECARVLEEIGVRMRRQDEKVAILSGGERQSISIGRATYFEAKLVILDEPTVALSIREAEKVLEFVQKIKRHGVSVVFITHNIYHVYPVADRFVILDRGIKIGEFYKKDVRPEDVIDVIRTGSMKSETNIA